MQQPGMTGQVKEDIITRLRELGVRVREGVVSFDPYLLSRDQFTSESRDWGILPGGREQLGALQAGCLAFSLCGTPVIYRLAETASIHVHMGSLDVETINGLRLGRSLSQSLFQRDNRVEKLIVDIPSKQLN